MPPTDTGDSETAFLQTIPKPAKIEWRDFQADPIEVALNALEDHRVAYVGDQDHVRMILVHSDLATWLSERCEFALDMAMEVYNLSILADDHPIADHTGDGDMGNPFGLGRPTAVEALTNSEDLGPLQFDLPSLDVWCSLFDPELTSDGSPLVFAVDPAIWEAMLAYLQDAIELSLPGIARRSKSRHADLGGGSIDVPLSRVLDDGAFISGSLFAGHQIRVFAHANPLRDYLYAIVPLTADDDTRQMPTFSLTMLYARPDRFDALLKESAEYVVIQFRDRACGKVVVP